MTEHGPRLRQALIDTILDLDVPEREWVAAAEPATPAELRAAMNELELALAWDRDQQHDLRGYLAHLREQHPGVENA
jgi:hypothetical protein